MKAVRLHRYGGLEGLALDEVAIPEPKPREILVRVAAASINPVDWKIRQGVQRALVRLRLPWILGLDVSGVVAAVGSQVSQFVIGDEVYASPSHKRPGTYAEYVCVREDELALKPANIDHVAAATLPLAGLTAYQALVGYARVRAGQRVLIHAGAGGVGSLAVQLAAHLGAEVHATCSERNLDFVQSLGATRAIDYRSEDFAAQGRTYDCVFDMLGGEVLERSLGCVRRGGTLVRINGNMESAVARWGAYGGVARTALHLAGFKLRARFRGVSSALITRRPSSRDLAALTRLVEQNAVRPIIGHVLPLHEVPQAHVLSQAGHVRGKIAIAVSR